MASTKMISAGAVSATPCQAAGTARPRSAAAARLPGAAAQRASLVCVRAAAEDVDSVIKGGAGQRWEQQLRAGKVTNVAARDLAAMQAEGWTVLDVRPSFEAVKAPVKGAVEVPLYVAAEDMSVGTLAAKWAFLGMGGGWWNGGTHTVPNPGFMPEVQAKVPRGAKVVVACQKGLRSLSAAEALSRAGYSPVAWVSGGLDNSRPGEVATTNGADVRMGGVGGVSEMLGWTEAQRDAAGGSNGFMGGPSGVIAIFAVILLLDFIWFGVTAYDFKAGAGL